MSVADTIASEFSSSILKAIRELARKNECNEDDVQITFAINSREELVHELLINYKFIRVLTLNEITYISIIYAPFKSQIPKRIKEFIIKVSDQYKVDKKFVSVIAIKNKNVMNSMKLMLYIRGKFEKWLTAESITEMYK